MGGWAKVCLPSLPSLPWLPTLPCRCPASWQPVAALSRLVKHDFAFYTFANLLSQHFSFTCREGLSVRAPRDRWGPSGESRGRGGGLVTESACWKCCGTIPWDRQCAAPARASIYLSMPAPFGGIPAKPRLGDGAGIGLCFRPLTRQAIITIILYTLVRV